MNDTTNDLPRGLFAKKPNETAPQFIKAKLSMKRLDFLEYLKAQEGEWLNFDVLEAKDGTKYYVRLDTWKPKEGGPVFSTNTNYKSDDIDPESIPF